MFRLLIGTLKQEELSIKYLLNDIIGSKYVVLYWFFIPLFSVYMAMPLFAHVKKEDKKPVFIYLVILGTVVNIAIPFLRKFYDWIPYSNSIKVDAVANYLLYVLIGWLLCNCDIKGWKRMLIYVVSVIGLMMHMIGTYCRSMASGTIDKTYKTYNNLPCLLYSVGIFVLIKACSPYLMKIKWINKLVNLLNGYTFSIYLMHWFVMTLLVKLFDLNIYSIWYRLGAPFVIIPICVLVIWVVRRIPIIKNIVP